MAQHDPVQDEINRQIRSSRTAQERALLQRPRTEDVTDIPPEGIESVLQRSDDSVGGVFTTTVKGESAREKAFRVKKEEGFKRFLAERAANEARQASQRSIIEGREALALNRERTGRASIVNANAALAKARAGGANLSEAAAKALGIPDFAGRISPTTGRAAAARNTAQEKLKREDARLEAAKAKAKITQTDRDRKFELDQIKESRLQTTQQVKAILAGTDVPEEAQQQISFTVNQALSKLQDPEVTPEVVDELFNEALGETFGDKKKAAALAKQRARARGFFVPE